MSNETIQVILKYGAVLFSTEQATVPLPKGANQGIAEKLNLPAPITHSGEYCRFRQWTFQGWCGDKICFVSRILPDYNCGSMFNWFMSTRFDLTFKLNLTHEGAYSNDIKYRPHHSVFQELSYTYSIEWETAFTSPVWRKFSVMVWQPTSSSVPFMWLRKTNRI